MKQIIVLGWLALATPAFAGGKEGSIGVGAEAGLDGEVGGASVNFDAGAFHVGGMLGYDRQKIGAMGNTTTETTFTLAARFFYHVHAVGQADFGVGGTLGLADVPNGMNHNQHVYLEPGFQIRAFITPNVALSFSAGIVIGTVDASNITLTGQVQALAGVHYYFF